MAAKDLELTLDQKIMFYLSYLLGIILIVVGFGGLIVLAGFSLYAMVDLLF